MFKKIKSGIEYFRNYHLMALGSCGFFHNMPDEEYLKRRYRIFMGEELHLDNPVLFTEKLQWLKLYDRRPEYTMLVDKYEVKKYVAEKVGKQYVIPTFGVWDRFEDIDFDKLPNQFVLKCTHDSGGFVICKDKKKLNMNAARRKLNRRLKRNYFWGGREWPYKNVKPRIIAEKYFDCLGKPESIEYKQTCFGGEVKFLTVCRGIAHDELNKRKNDFYDRDFNFLPFVTTYYANSNIPNEKPKELDTIINICETLSAGIPTVRVDCYIIDGQVYFGEMTFFTWNGFIHFDPPEWNKTLGDWIKLPPVIKE